MPSSDPRLTPARPDLAAAQLRGQVSADEFVEGRPVQIRVGIADLRREPRPDSAIDTQALFGEAAMLYEDHEGWGWVQLARDGYVGYLSMTAVGPALSAPTHWVAVNRSFVYPGPNMKLPPLEALPLGARVAVSGASGAFAQIDEAAYVFAAHLRAADERESDFVAAAERFLHAPYLWGGKTSLGIDCSGLVQASLDAAGISAPRDTDLQEKALGRALAFDETLESLERGDLVFWRGHIGIMRSATELLHANAHHMLVASEPLRDARDRILASTGAQITSIRRL
ncbi:NlpC/P60 family protein [Methylocapsa acidiphila]|uniref:C40 family peptidase n=1 Tax=Methylocapsa acidiphila TaxID=133552 RepID=UPI00047901EF|nr:NlpC/P60 family protein [Methylocapsa acidiphila]